MRQLKNYQDISDAHSAVGVDLSQFNACAVPTAATQRTAILPLGRTTVGGCSTETITAKAQAQWQLLAMVFTPSSAFGVGIKSVNLGMTALFAGCGEVPMEGFTSNQWNESTLLSEVVVPAGVEICIEVVNNNKSEVDVAGMLIIVICATC